MQSLLKNYRTNILAILLLIFAWQTIYYIASEPMVFPSLYDIAISATQVIPTELFWITYFKTMLTLAQAWFLAIILVIFTVCICSLNTVVRQVFEKYCSYFMPLPSFVIIPFVTLILGLGKSALLIVMVFSVFWAMSFQLLGAFDTAKLNYSKHVKNLGWGLYKSIFLVYIPAAAPTIFTICSMGWTYMWRVLISIEVAYGAIGGYYGLGTYMIEVKNKLDVQIMYVILLTIAITGVAINSFISYLSKRYNWKEIL